MSARREIIAFHSPEKKISGSSGMRLWCQLRSMISRRRNSRWQRHSRSQQKSEATRRCHDNRSTKLFYYNVLLISRFVKSIVRENREIMREILNFSDQHDRWNIFPAGLYNRRCLMLTNNFLIIIFWVFFCSWHKMYRGNEIKWRK